MKRIILICAVVLGFAFTAAAQTDSKPEFKFNEETHDFGKIPQGNRLLPNLCTQTLAWNRLF